MVNNFYLCIDLKTFYASVECVERKLDPFKTNLVVADPSRGNGAFCLAITPAMKNLGIKNRCRIFEIPKKVKYIVAIPRMKLYMQYSAKIYSIYLNYIAKEDIHIYSIDEAFLDVTQYLKLYKMSAKELGIKIIKDIYQQTGITATVGIGTNMFLAKIALDIIAKKDSSNIGFLDENLFKEKLWYHEPLDDFWQIGRGIANRLNKMDIKNMHDIAQYDKAKLYKEFGINAELIIDHASGIEPCTIKEIKEYKPKSNSVSFSQILFKDYTCEKARLVLKEMVDLGSLDLVNKELVTNSVHLFVGYSKDIIKPSSGTIRMIETTNVYSTILRYFLDLFDNITVKDVSIRRIGITFLNVRKQIYEQLDLFTDQSLVEQERKMEFTMNHIKQRHGKNAILRGINLEEGATTIKRNQLIGGHNSGE